MRDLNTNYKKILIGIIIIIAIFLFSVIFSIANINNTKILKWISVSGINVSEMTKKEALEIVSNTINNKEKNIIVKIGDYQAETSFENLRVNYNVESYIDQAYNLGRSGNIFTNNFEILKLIVNNKNIEIKADLNEEKLNNFVDDVCANLPNKVIQSSYYIEDDNLIITNGKKGEIINKEELKEKIYEKINNINSEKNEIEVIATETEPDKIDVDKIYNEIYKEVKDAYYENNPFKVYPEVIGVSFNKEELNNLLQEQKDEYTVKLEYTEPKVTINDLDVDIFQDNLGSFTTKYDPQNTNRANNLKLASEKINGKILSPGEEFSYNKIVGARTIAAGYKEAKIYSNGKVIDGLGGGICQLSSTLYNAVIYANLEVTERHNHQFLTSYVKAGRDATVAYGAKDLKFINNRSYPIKIETKASNGVVYCTIYGIKEETEYDIDFDIETIYDKEPEVKYEYDNSIPVGKEEIKQAGSNAMSVKVYKITKLNNNIISKTLISEDKYNPLEKIVIKKPN